MDAPTINRRSALTLATAIGVSCATGQVFATPDRGSTMLDSALKLCDRYYTAWQHKDLDAILACLHPDIVFKSPTATTHGRDAYAAAARRFLSLVDRIEVRKTFAEPNAAMVAVDFYCIQPIGLCPTAERIELTNGLIVEDELFFDARPFEAFARASAAAEGKK